MKVRAWGEFLDDKGPVMWEPEYIEFNDLHPNKVAPCLAVDCEPPIPYDDHVIMWPSSRHDKNGQEIMESDIIHTKAKDKRIEGDFLAVVERVNGKFMARYLIQMGLAVEEPAFDLDCLLTAWDLTGSGTKIVGNIYENKDLTEPKNEIS